MVVVRVVAPDVVVAEQPALGRQGRVDRALRAVSPWFVRLAARKAEVTPDQRVADLEAALATAAAGFCFALWILTTPPPCEPVRRRRPGIGGMMGLVVANGGDGRPPP